MAGDRFHVVTEMHDTHGEWDVGTAGARRKAVSVPSFEGAAKCVADVGTHVESPHQHVADFASGREVVDCPVVRAGLDRRDDVLLFLRRVTGGRVSEHVAHRPRPGSPRHARASARESRSRHRRAVATSCACPVQPM